MLFWHGLGLEFAYNYATFTYLWPRPHKNKQTNWRCPTIIEYPVELVRKAKAVELTSFEIYYFWQKGYTLSNDGNFWTVCPGHQVLKVAGLFLISLSCEKISSGRCRRCRHSKTQAERQLKQITHGVTASFWFSVTKLNVGYFIPWSSADLKCLQSSFQFDTWQYVVHTAAVKPL